MIELSWIAEIILNVFYAGRPKVDKRLDIEDFEQHVKLANASIMRKLYFDMRREGIEQAYFGYQLNPPITVKLSDKDWKGRRTADLDDTIMRLPRNLGVFSISPVMEDESCGCEKTLRIMDNGQQNIYCGKDYEDIAFAQLYADRVVTYNVPDCITEVEIEGIFNTSDTKVPLDIAFDIFNFVMGSVLKVEGFPVDKSDDNNPNLIEYKHRLAEGASVK